MSLITKIWGHLGLSEEEKAKSDELQEKAIKQREIANELTDTVTQLNERNGFGWKFNAALRGVH